MSAQIKLSDAELELIELNREKEARRQEELKAEEREKQLLKIREAEARKDAMRKEQAEKIELATKLLNADTEGLLTVVWRDHEVTGVSLPWIYVEINENRKEIIDIAKHYAWTSTSYKGKQQGWKYSMSRSLGDYNTKWIKNPATVLKNARLMKETYAARIAAEQRELSTRESVEAALVEKYPNLKVSFVAKGRHGGFNYSDVWKIDTGRGTIIYTANKVDGVVVPQLSRVVPKADIFDEVIELMLKS